MENVNDPNESLKHYDLTEGLVKAWIPLMEKIATGNAVKYLVETTGPTHFYFVTKDGKTFLQLEFKIAGLKIEPQNPRPVGIPIGKCKLPLRAVEGSNGEMTIPENIQFETKFSGLGDDRLKTGSFRMLIPISKAVIEEKW